MDYQPPRGDDRGAVGAVAAGDVPEGGAATGQTRRVIQYVRCQYASSSWETVTPELLDAWTNSPRPR
jgi:hypothetical protein